ncbi:alpha/beta fold hydrolase [Xylanibacter oryzae]|uniref:alpha/beta fold hydrolase n=1 Tax=Xylanibacter oryzae TaxID=185293 RepID=UPI0009FEC4FC|nr:alpha/beta hydrolase [Xylanibacter oryzae]
MKRLSNIITIIIMLASSMHICAQQMIKMSDGTKLYVEVRGSGTPCLYLHGGPGSGSEWMQKLGGDILEKHFKVIYLDQRGVGRSESPRDSDYTLSRQIKDFEEVRQALGINSWLVLGHSFGGILTMAYWEAHKDKIDGLIFMNCTLCMDASFRDSWLPKAIGIIGNKANKTALDPNSKTIDRMMAVFPFLNNANRWQIFTPQKKYNDTVNSATDYYKHNSDGSKVIFMDEYWRDFRPLTYIVDKPVLFFYGKKDYAVGPNFYKGVHFPKMLLVGADCGHFPFIEVPNKLNKALDDYTKMLSKQSH